MDSMGGVIVVRVVVECVLLMLVGLVVIDVVEVSLNVFVNYLVRCIIYL